MSTGQALRDVIRLMRPHQWSKNLLVFLPIVFAHELGAFVACEHAAIAFLSFDLVASCGYVFNDIHDREQDRLHPTKKNRPVASGAVSVQRGMWVALTLLLVASGLAVQLSWNLCLALAGYLCLTTAYSKWFKSYVLIDVLALASLYTTRIVVGAIALPVVPSIWLLSLSMFIFLSLALVKRYTELLAVGASQRSSGLRGRDYSANDMDALRAMGVAAGTTAVLVLALYIDSAQATHQYANPLWLWPACPILWYWISRMWIKTTRGEMHDDPVVYSLADKASWLSFAVIAICWINASLGLGPYLHGFSS
jgi:4-hydroxybenzoate polyprenyltransferase